MDLLERLAKKAAPIPQQQTVIMQPPPAPVSTNGTSALSAFGEPCDRVDGQYKENGEVVFVVDGRKFVLAAFEDTDYLAIEAYLRQERKSAVKSLADAINEINSAPEAIREALLDRAYRDIRKTAKVDDISRKDVAEWLDTRPGVIYSLWMKLAKRYPGLAEANCEYMLMRLSMEKAMQMRDESMAKDLQELTTAGVRNGVPSKDQRP